MGNAVQVVPMARLGGVDARHVRNPWSLPSFAFFTSVCFVLVPVIDPSSAFAMTREVVTAPAEELGPPQTITVEGDVTQRAARSPFTTSRYQASAPSVGRPDPGTAQAIAYEMVIARGWDDAEFACLVSLWNRESHWNVYAKNKSSGAYGIPQAWPGEKMASVAPDWETNPVTQITWGLGYIAGRYQTPCGAWTSSEERGWY